MPTSPAHPRKTRKAVATTSARTVARGDTAPSTRAAALEKFVASEATHSAQSKVVAAALELVKPNAAGTAAQRANALRAILEGASPDDALVLRKALTGRTLAAKDKGANPDDELTTDWRDGGYPYRNLSSSTCKRYFSFS